MKNNLCIGILVAMEIEKKAIIELLNEREIINIHSCEFIIGNYHNHKIILGQSEVGKVNASMATIIMYEHFQPDLIINTGIAGGFDRKLHTLDIVVVTTSSYSDVDLGEEFDEQYGQIPNMPYEYQCDYQWLKDFITNKQCPNIYFGKLLTGDQFVTSYEKAFKIVNQYFPKQNVLVFDMEGTAVAQVAYRLKVPVILVKCISDLIGVTTIQEYNNFSYLASMKTQKIIKIILDNIKM